MSSIVKLAMFDHTLLPPEIWLEIIDWATFNPNLFSGDVPFARIPTEGACADPNLQIRARISAVCRSWNAWVVGKLYEDVKVGRDVATLCQTLERSRNIDGFRYAQFVHRLVLPYRSTTTSSPAALQSAGLLRLCTRVHTLFRPLLGPRIAGLQFDHEVQTVDLPSLRRLAWWHHMEAERTGGINSLGATLSSSPNLEYLFIGGVVGSSYLGTHHAPIELIKLHTLRLNIQGGILLRHIVSRWMLPSLQRIILDSLPVREGTHVLWEEFGNQLQSVEFGRHLHFLQTDSLTQCLRHCPGLQELNYHLFFTAFPEFVVGHNNLATVGLHAHVNQILSDVGISWHMVTVHFNFLCHPGFPMLRFIDLYGDWRQIIHHPKFVDIQQKLRSCNRTLRVTSGTDMETASKLRVVENA